MHYVTSEDLHQWRRSRKLRQNRLAELLGVTPTTVCNWEAGRTRTPKDLSERLEKLAFDLAPRPQLKEPDWITMRTHGDLYVTEGRTSGKVTYPRWNHPRPLIERGYLTLEECDLAYGPVAEGAKPTNGAIPAVILKHPAYKRAVELYKLHHPDKS